MKLKEGIEKRRTIRDFQDKMVPARIVEYAIENGFKASSGMGLYNRQQA